MKEKEFISTIKDLLNSKYIGDDCAYLKDIGITISQDSLVENIHFKKEYITAYQLGYKSVMVNLSDIAASGAKPKYITVSLSLPPETENNFIKDFYKGAKDACGKDVEIVGGDITGADKIFISICAIGLAEKRNISSRKNAQIGQKIIVSGQSGASAAGFKLLQQYKKEPENLILAHLSPKAQIKFGENVSTNVKTPYAMMDTSDGLLETLSTIANDSKVLLDVDFDKIPFLNEIKIFSDWQDLILFGGEDYQIVACVPESYKGGIEIGRVKKGLGVDLKMGKEIIHYSKEDIDQMNYNHFGREGK